MFLSESAWVLAGHQPLHFSPYTCLPRFSLSLPYLSPCSCLRKVISVCIINIRRWSRMFRLLWWWHRASTGGGDGGGEFTSHALKHILFGSYERPDYPSSPLVSLTSQPNYYKTVVIWDTYLYNKTECLVVALAVVAVLPCWWWWTFYLFHLFSSHAVENGKHIALLEAICVVCWFSIASS